MANSTTNLDTISSSQASKEITANALFDAASAATTYGRRASTTSALTWGYYGGNVTLAAGTMSQIANGTVALTASATNYIVAAKSTGTVSVSTATTNWNDTNNYWRLYSVVTGASSVTSYTDSRQFGLFSGFAANAITKDGLTTTTAVIPFAEGLSVPTGKSVTGAGTASIAGFNTIAAATGMAVGGATPGAGGIAFPATAVAVADANTFDDYEEGTWTPNIEGLTTAGSPSYSSRIANYTKSGRLANVEMFVEGTWSSAPAGGIKISGLPFVASGTISFPAVKAAFGWMNDNAYVHAVAGASYLLIGKTSGISSALSTASFGADASITNFQIHFELTYFTS